MKNSFLLGLSFSLTTCFLIFILTENAFAIETKGLQPVQPNGIFSSFSAHTLSGGSFAAGLDYEKGIDINYDRLALKASFGITDEAEMLLTVPFILNWDEKDGFEDINLGFKHKIFSEEVYGPSVAYLLKGSLPTGRSIFSTDGSAGGGIIVSKKIGPFSSNINLTYSEPFKSSLNEQIEVIAGFSLKAAHDFDILAELYAVDSYESKHFDTVELRFGYRLRTTDYIRTIVGVGFDLHDRTPELRLMISFNLLFDNTRSIGY